MKKFDAAQKIVALTKVCFPINFNRCFICYIVAKKHNIEKSAKRNFVNVIPILL